MKAHSLCNDQRLSGSAALKQYIHPWGRLNSWLFLEVDDCVSEIFQSLLDDKLRY